MPDDKNITKKRSLNSASLSLYDDDEIASSSGSKRIHSEETNTSKLNSNDEQKVKNAEKFPSFFVVSGCRKGERDEMQDRHVIMNAFPLDVDDIKRSAFIALFDGHAGKKAADYCAMHFGDRIASNCAKYILPSKNLVALGSSMKKILTESYKNIDDEFLREAKKQRPALKDGTTATTLLLVNDVLYCANLGDSRAIVCRQKIETKETLAMQITVDHSPLMFNERMRIQKAGGIVKDGRVLGVLEVSRSIGDGQYKAFGVTCVPDIKKLTLTPQDLFVVLACDGLWKTFSSEETINFILSKFAALKSDFNFLKNLTSDNTVSAIWQKVADELSATAVLKGCGDNVSVVLLVFNKNFEKFVV